jgi:RimJ/RimL family protein N-acetyltransferase
VNETWQLDRTLTSPRIGGEPPRLRLVPLTLEHAEAFLAATGDRPDEVFAHLSYDPPRDLEQARAVIERLNAPATQQPYAQIVAETGEFAGTTSFYDIDPKLRALAIGHTWISRPWWRSWLNTSSKLTLLTHAFEQLGAERMVWHTDIRNLRSRQAILRLGAQQEGVLRHHRIRRDGSWRDTVQFSMLADEWPAARGRLYERLALGSAEAGTSGSGREGRS